MPSEQMAMSAGQQEIVQEAQTRSPVAEFPDQKDKKISLPAAVKEVHRDRSSSRPELASAMDKGRECIYINCNHLDKKGSKILFSQFPQPTSHLNAHYSTH